MTAGFYRMTLACACIVLACLLPSCVPPPISRSSLPCPPPPPPPSCTTTAYVGTGILSAEWTMIPVRGLSTAGVEELYSGDTLVGSTFQTVSLRPSRPGYATTVLPGSAVGDADIVELDGSETRRLPFSAEVFWDGHPTTVAVAGDDALVVFASDRPGSLGGTDLWYVGRRKGQWQTPTRLETVNTPCDELSPFFDARTSTLYFASPGHTTLGGYDALASRLTISKTSTGADTIIAAPPVNLGAPVNSRLDDVFPSMVGDSVYITSNRREGTDMDVYVSIRPLAAAPPDAERPIDRSAPGSTLLTGTVIDESTQSPVADIEVNATRSDTREVVASTRTDTVGRYRLQVPTETPITISAQSDTLFFASYDTTFPASASERSVELPTALSLPSVFILRVNFPTSVFDAPYDMTLDSNGRETSQPWRSAIDLLATNVRASGARLRRLILTGHTDDVDTETANLELGRQRVDFVIDQLLQRGVPRGVLEGRSAGERELPARRPDESAEQWRKRARRVELVKVLQE